MSLLGIDVGTTGCKASAFTLEGHLLASAYEEYDIRRPRPGWAELVANDVWNKAKSTIRQVAVAAKHDPIRALSVSSLGEAMVPVTGDRQILGSSILAFDVRGEQYLAELRNALADDLLYHINGNTWGNHYGLTKLKWIQEHQPQLYQRAHKFLLWASFISFMLGAEPVVDYSLANRTLLFDMERKTWSTELLGIAQIDAAKLPVPVPTGTEIGTVTPSLASELGLPARVSIVSGAHDQCANAVGCGVIGEGSAMYGMGTFVCIVPVFSSRLEPTVMMERGLNTEHHAVPGQYVSFIYNQGGSLVKWFRDTFAATDRNRAAQVGGDIYAELFAEMPESPSSLMVLPHFDPTGPPDFISDSCGVIAGLCLGTTRGEILKGIVEGVTYYLKACVDALPATGIGISDFRAVGGGSRSDAWVQISADIMGRPFVRPRITEAGTLGAAVIAGSGCGLFPSMQVAVDAMVHLECTFQPNPQEHERYRSRFDQYKTMWPLMGGFLRTLGSNPS